MTVITSDHYHRRALAVVRFCDGDLAGRWPAIAMPSGPTAGEELSSAAASQRRGLLDMSRRAACQALE